MPDGMAFSKTRKARNIEGFNPEWAEQFASLRAELDACTCRDQKNDIIARESHAYKNARCHHTGDIDLARTRWDIAVGYYDRKVAA